MRITIAERLKPFSHIPGTFFVLPLSTLRFQIFPSHIRVHDLSNKDPTHVQEIFLQEYGPMEQFTVQQDLERGCILVWGKTEQDWIRYSIAATSAQTFEIRSDKSEKTIPDCSRLSLGYHKAQDWTLVRRRLNLGEIFPFWHRLGQLVPKSLGSESKSLLSICRNAVHQNNKEKILHEFRNLFLAGFDQVLSPRSFDNDYQGFPLSPISNDDPLLAILSEGSQLIEQMFIKCVDGKTVHILPMLPSEFHAGRLLQAKCGQGIIDLEWSKKKIRRMIYRSTQADQVEFIFPKGIKKYRLQKAEDGTVLFFDRFEQ